ncbi:MAG: rpiB [Crocinitomicaceae bacterium]|jgi:ribose 5-phosphate isomerase B|nr:rpiB [Crocinitomicaceae bacterium]
MTKILPIGCDHAGFELKTKIIAFLEQQGYKIDDKGCYSTESIDYPDFAHPVAEAVENHPEMLGILLCGSGNGINMTANKHQGVRAALCWTPEIARLAREHNNANILTLPARFIEEQTALDIVEVFLSTEFEGGRHQKRVEKIPL